MKKIRLITASYGNDRQQLKILGPLTYKGFTIDQVFYNHTNTKSRENSLHPRLKGKIPKMMEWFEHPDYDYYIWIDSKFSILDGFLENMLEYINESNTDLFLFEHNDRSSIKEEMDYMIEEMKYTQGYLYRRYHGESLQQQVNKYTSDKNFTDDKLFYGGLFMYSKKLVENKNENMMIDWLLNCVLYGIQDQLWLPYLIHQHQINYKIYPHDLLNNSFVKHG